VSRFLILPFAPGRVLSHLGTCMCVAEELRARGHEAAFGYGGELSGVIEQAGFGWHPVPEVQLLSGWDVSGWFPQVGDLEAAVRANLDLIEGLRPDAAVIDSATAARIACDLTGLPDLTISQWLPALRRFARRRDNLRRRGRLLLQPRRVLAMARLKRETAKRSRGGSLPTIGGPGAEALLGRINAVRASHGLAPVRSVLAEAWTGRLIACTSTPFLDPARGLPPNAHYVGPLNWSGTGEGPAPRRSDRPLVFVSQGSTGRAEVLRRTVEELGTEPVDVAVCTTGVCDPEEIAALADNVFAQSYLPGRAWLEAADAAVIHGGLMTAGEAHRAGTPVAVVPTVRDHLITARRVEELGVGISLWPTPVRGGIARAVRKLLSAPRYRRRAARLAEQLRPWDGAANAADLAERLAGS
jgi:MGT family glycosyltransferase